MTSALETHVRDPGHSAGPTTGEYGEANPWGQHGTTHAVEGFQPVLSIRARVEEREVPSFVHSALREIRDYIEEQHINVEGPPFSICRPIAPRGVDVEVGWPVNHGAGIGRIAGRALPTALVRRGPDRT